MSKSLKFEYHFLCFFKLQIMIFIIMKLIILENIKVLKFKLVYIVVNLTYQLGQHNVEKIKWEDIFRDYELPFLKFESYRLRRPLVIFCHF